MRFAAYIALLAAVGCADDHRTDEQCVLGADAPADDDAAAEPTPPAVPPGLLSHSRICDGSADLRLVVAEQTNGPSAAASRFLGSALLIVDGECRYHVRTYEYGDGVVTGWLDSVDLERLTRELALNTLSTLPSSRDDCADHTSDRLIATPDAALRCRCEECRGSAEATLAMLRANQWIERLASLGTPVRGAVQAVARLQMPEPKTAPFQTQNVLRWPLDREIDDTPGLEAEWFAPESGARFEPPEADSLRRVRRETDEMWQFEAEGIKFPSSYVNDCVDTYELLVRDELPEPLAEQLASFLPAAWSRPHIETCTLFGFEEPMTPCPPD